MSKLDNTPELEIGWHASGTKRRREQEPTCLVQCHWQWEKIPAELLLKIKWVDNQPVGALLVHCRHPFDLCFLTIKPQDCLCLRWNQSVLDETFTSSCCWLLPLTARLCFFALQVEKRHVLILEPSKKVSSQSALPLSFPPHAARPLRVKARPPDSAAPRLFLGWLGIITIEKKCKYSNQTLTTAAPTAGTTQRWPVGHLLLGRLN